MEGCKFSKNSLARRSETFLQKVYLQLICRALRSALPLFLAIVTCSCFEQPNCLIDNTNVMKIALKSKTDGSNAEVTFDYVHVVNLNSKLYENQKTSALQIPVDPNQTETKIIFSHDAQSDTLVVKYRNETRLISPDCGAYLYQKDLNVVKSNFYEVRVINSLLLTNVATNLEILL